MAYLPTIQSCVKLKGKNLNNWVGMLPCTWTAWYKSHLFKLCDMYKKAEQTQLTLILDQNNRGDVSILMCRSSWDDNIPTHRALWGSLHALIRMKMKWIIWCVLHSHQISTEMNTGGRFWTNVSERALLYSGCCSSQCYCIGFAYCRCSCYFVHFLYVPSICVHLYPTEATYSSTTSHWLSRFSLRISLKQTSNVFGR